MHPPGRRRRGHRAGGRRRGRPRGRRALSAVRARAVTADRLGAPLALLEGALRGGERLPQDLRSYLRAAVERGDVAVVAAWSSGGAREDEDEPSGAAVVAYRPSVSGGGLFASVEEVQVRPEARGRGVGRALLEAALELCSARGVSYVEVQTDAEAEPFYAALGFEAAAEVRVLSRSLPLEVRGPPSDA